ncbi:FMN-binding protein [Ruminococcaceae bacterium OttesenSCG-928-O06]|nr:FMN-binding protein [Ruminococcaceae bacterium OttesenSCG-928-O06]
MAEKEKTTLQPEEAAVEEKVEAAPKAEAEAAAKKEAAPQAEQKDATDSDFKKNVWGPFLHPLIALVGICIITSLLLGLTNMLTEPLIEENLRVAAETTRKELLPEADGFEEMDIGGAENVTSIFRATNGVGWVIEAYGTGYGGKVPAMVAFTEDGTIAGVTFMENSETPGLGKKVESEEWFSEQFAGFANQAIGLGDIDKIASATISTNAALNAVNAAVEAFNQQTGQSSGTGGNFADVLESLLPGASLTPINITADNVQPTAWRSANGEYIIVGERPDDNPDNPSVVVAAVAISPEGVVLNLWLDTSGENYGATLPNNREFVESFIGESAPVQVDVVADITGTSNKVMDAVNSALAALPIAKEAA